MVESAAPAGSLVIPVVLVGAPSNEDILRDFRSSLRARILTPCRARAVAWRAEVSTLQFAQACLGEFFGMTLFLFIVLTSIVYSFPLSAADPLNDAASFNSATISRNVLIAATFGLTIAVLVFALSTSSGGHLNPAISFALFLRGSVSLPRFIIYSLMQMAGACAGVAYARSLNPTLFDALRGPDGVMATGCNQINYALYPGFTVWTAFGAEMLATALLIWAVLASGDVGTLPGTRRTGALNPLSIGLAVFLCHLALIPLDGTSINPARSFGTAAISNFWTDQWIFWVAPFVGAIIACVSYELFFFGRRSAHPAAPGAPRPAVVALSTESGQVELHTHTDSMSMLGWT